MKNSLFIFSLVSYFIFGVNNSMFNFIIETTEKEIINQIKYENRSITFNENYKPSINSFYTKNRFTPSEKEIFILEKDLSSLFLESQEKELSEYLGYLKGFSENQVIKLNKKYQKIIKKESRRLMKYNKFYFGFITKTGEKRIMIMAIDFSSLSKEDIKEIKTKKISKLLFTSEWNGYGGIVHEGLVYNPKKNVLYTSGIASRITRFKKVQCGTYE